MSYFQNPFAQDFRGVWLLGDRQHQPTFVCPLNAGRGPELFNVWVEPPYDLSGNDADGNSTDTLTFQFAIDSEFKNWVAISVDITADAASTSAVKAEEIISALNADSGFSSFFVASLSKFDSGNNRVIIRQKHDVNKMKSFVVNGRAESVLRFNARAGVAELPTYFDRHKVKSYFTAAELESFTDSCNILIPLDPVGSTVDADIIDNAVDRKGKSLGYDSGTVQEDYQLLGGRSGLFNFQKITVDANDRITEIIEYPAGAKVGDFARKITYTYTASNTKPDEIFEIPYTLTSSDLITP